MNTIFTRRFEIEKACIGLYLPTTDLRLGVDEHLSEVEANPNMKPNNSFNSITNAQPSIPTCFIYCPTPSLHSLTRGWAVPTATSFGGFPSSPEAAS